MGKSSLIWRIKLRNMLRDFKRKHIIFEQVRFLVRLEMISQSQLLKNIKFMILLWKILTRIQIIIK